MIDDDDDSNGWNDGVDEFCVVTAQREREKKKKI